MHELFGGEHFVQYGVAKNDLFNDLHDMMYSFDHNKLYALPYFKSNSYKYHFSNSRFRT